MPFVVNDLAAFRWEVKQVTSNSSSWKSILKQGLAFLKLIASKQ